MSHSHDDVDLDKTPASKEYWEVFYTEGPGTKQYEWYAHDAHIASMHTRTPHSAHTHTHTHTHSNYAHTTRKHASMQYAPRTTHHVHVSVHAHAHATRTRSGTT